MTSINSFAREIERKKYTSYSSQRRPRFQSTQQDRFTEKYRKNRQILANPIFLIDAKGEKIGKMPTEKALTMAQEIGLDLVEVAPNADPPVCKIIDWAKFKYEQQKKLREQKKKTKMKKDKGMRFPATIDIGDKKHKLKRVQEFLQKGHRVTIDVYVKGRMPFEKAEELMSELMGKLSDKYKATEEKPEKTRNRLSITFLP